MTDQEYRKIMEQYCDKHCRGNCNYYGMIHCWDYSNGHREWDERCPLLVKKAQELLKEQGK